MSALAKASGALKSVDYEVFGRVQGVCFRMYTEEEARKLGVVGWVKNTSQGTVTGQVQGPEDKVNAISKEEITLEYSPESMNCMNALGKPFLLELMILEVISTLNDSVVILHHRDKWGGGCLHTPEEQWVGALNFKVDAINDKLKLQVLIVLQYREPQNHPVCGGAVSAGHHSRVSRFNENATDFEEPKNSSGPGYLDVRYRELKISAGETKRNGSTWEAVVAEQLLQCGVLNTYGVLNIDDAQELPAETLYLSQGTQRIPTGADEHPASRDVFVNPTWILQRLGESLEFLQEQRSTRDSRSICKSHGDVPGTSYSHWSGARDSANGPSKERNPELEEPRHRDNCGNVRASHAKLYLAVLQICWCVLILVESGPHVRVELQKGAEKLALPWWQLSQGLLPGLLWPGDAGRAAGKPSCLHAVSVSTADSGGVGRRQQLAKAKPLQGPCA
ncbi:hypothetical protein BTVI_132930 [Pitangus sulphuratus]|nr:hypothetical protein BTVI_132930 [Pitangus sulphuratus]